MKKKSSRLQKNFGGKIREIRHKLKISQEELGFQTGLDRTYISGIERGVRNPSLKNIGKIASALKLKIQEIFRF